MVIDFIYKVEFCIDGPFSINRRVTKSCTHFKAMIDRLQWLSFLPPTFF